MHPSGSFSFDDSTWPLLVVRLTGEPSLKTFEEFLSRSTQYLQRQERHVCIFDVSELHLLSTEQRQRQVEWLKTNEVLMRQALLGIAYVITSPIVRLTMGVIFHFKSPPAPYTIVSHPSEAGTWAAMRLEEARLRAPAEHVRREYRPLVEVQAGLISGRGVPGTAGAALPPHR
ncbi:MAG TPA: hypothetical protein VF794_36990 [Archangium sp.]|jgi:hypothetical protein|uniref:hypothetical protein n=1 Tax=Archangium sp. TaxID=1872627 RepID=UPI002EDAD741